MVSLLWSSFDPVQDHRETKSGWTWRLLFSPKFHQLASALQVPGHFLENEPTAGLDAACMASSCPKVSPAVFKSIPVSAVDANAAPTPTQACPVHSTQPVAPASHTTASHTQLQPSATAQQQPQAPPITLSQPLAARCKGRHSTWPEQNSVAGFVLRSAVLKL